MPAAARAASTEVNIVPIAGGDSDVGIGFGQVSDLARLDPAYQPFKWRLETNAFITFKAVDASHIINPYQDYFLLLSLPGLGPGGRLRLDIRPAFTEESTLRFYGFGNATPLPQDYRQEDLQYGRIHPTLQVEARTALGGGWFAHVGSVYTHNWLTVPPTGLLAAAYNSGSPAQVRSLFGVGAGAFAPHGVELFEVGLQFDSRDSEIVTQRGQFHSVEARWSPAVGSTLPYAYQQINAAFRFYSTPVPRWLSLSARLVGDVLFGAPPFYELARFDQTAALGGGRAVRGVPAQRYYGKVKVFENLEARSDLLTFTVKGKRMALGIAGFVDAGRVWTELGTRHPDLDGTGLGLKYGVGGGLRLAQGKTFVVRADVAWSPDAQPVGAYFAAGEIF